MLFDSNGMLENLLSHVLAPEPLDLDMHAN
jgi:hypothetical protein